MLLWKATLACCRQPENRVIFEGFGCIPAWNMDYSGQAENLAVLM